MSQHYIIRPLTYELVWSNNNALKHVTEKVNERLLDIQLDDKVYTRNRLFRVLGACKRGDEHIPGRRLSRYGAQDRLEIYYLVTYLRDNVPQVNVPYEQPICNSCSSSSSCTSTKRKASYLDTDYQRVFKCLRQEIPELRRQQDHHLYTYQDTVKDILRIQVVAKNNNQSIECQHMKRKHGSNTTSFCYNITNHIGWFSCPCTPGKIWGKQDCFDLVE